MSGFIERDGLHIETSGLPDFEPLAVGFRITPSPINQETIMSLTFDTIRLAGIDYAGPIEVQLTSYLDANAGSPAIVLITHEEGFPDLLSKVTLNMAGTGSFPAEGCVFVKDYSEGEGMLQAFVDKGWMQPTGRTVRSGWVTVPEAKLIGELAELVKAGQR
ncbi:hypothetical protein PBI_DEWDROP_100 [Microbacterium phage Dewdrop]|nr:hypothetical protein PBI_LEAF_100 [Microbacterium phage Leaf]QGZ17468.1 hypothetical protein PBI_DEWDROP_100 [Microbacterium phage Dewdrop]